MKFLPAKIISPVLAVALALSAGLAGCAAKEPTAQEIVTSAVSATGKVDNYKIDTDIAMTISGLNNPVMEKMDIVMNGTSTADIKNKRMQAKMNAAMDIPGQGKQSVVMDLYMLDGWMYSRMDVPMLGQQWIKMKLPEQAWQAQNQTAQQIELLKTAVKVESLPNETVNGTACYVLKITPDAKAVMNWMLSQQFSGMDELDVDTAGLAESVKNVSVKEWIAKDTYLITRAEMSAFFDTSSLGSPTPSGSDEAVSVSMSGQVRFYDYNKGASISLPHEAENATDISSGR